MPKGILKDVVSAYKLLISKGYPIAANNLGSMYYCGRYFARNVDKAIEYYEQAAEDGVQIAWGNLGCCYYYDKKDYKKAYEAFSEGAYLFDDPECLYMLGDMYKKGYYVEPSRVKAFHLYDRAMKCINSNDQRDHSLQGDIQCRIGEMIIEDADGKDMLVAGLKNLYIGVGIMYENLHENRFVDANIQKYKKLIDETEKLLNKTQLFPEAVNGEEGLC